MTEPTRKRGRPRKHPLPEGAQQQQQSIPHQPSQAQRTKGKRKKKELELPPELAEAEHLTTASPAWKQLYTAISREFR